MTFYQELQLNQAGSKNLLKKSETVKEKSYHILVYLVKFHVGAENWRSRKAMEKLGAEFKGEVMVAYHGEPTKQNVEYWIKKENWK